MHTFLFADLVGFTALSIERGDEEAATSPPGFRARCEARRRAPGDGREVARRRGDGAGRRRGRRLRLGIELANGLDGLPPVRVGLNTGPAVERDGDFFGSDREPRGAAGQAARGGEVLLTERRASPRAARRPRLEPRGARRSATPATRWSSTRPPTGRRGESACSPSSTASSARG